MPLTTEGTVAFANTTDVPPNRRDKAASCCLKNQLVTDVDKIALGEYSVTQPIDDLADTIYFVDRPLGGSTTCKRPERLVILIGCSLCSHFRSLRVLLVVHLCFVGFVPLNLLQGLQEGSELSNEVAILLQLCNQGCFESLADLVPELGHK